VLSRSLTLSFFAAGFGLKQTTKSRVNVLFKKFNVNS